MQQPASSAYKINAADISARVFLGSSLLRTVEKREDAKEVWLHYHTQYELFVAREAPLVLQIEEKEYTFINTAVCIAPFVRHFVKSRQDAYGLRFELKQPHALFATPIRTLEIGAFGYACLAQLADVHQQSTPISQEMAASLLSLIFLDLYNANVYAVAQPARNTMDDYCMVIDDFVNRHYEESISLEQVAAALHLSTKHTSRIIRARYHSTLSAMLNEKRLNVAAYLLTHTEKSVTEIAEQLFGRSDHYFYRLFRERHGISPLQYRKQKRAELDSSYDA